jgi:hypothetical protein
MTDRPIKALGALALSLWLAACATPEVKPPPKPEPPPPDPRVALMAKADDAFERGTREYDAGNFDSAVRELQASLDFGVMPTPKQLDARKTMAFSHCLQKRVADCRAEFRKILEISPNYELKPTEVGHPDWGSVFKTERDRVLADLLEERRQQELAKLPLPERYLADGMHRYDAGEFAAALRLLQDAMREGLASREDRLKATKHSAFCYCLDGKSRECKAEFSKLFDIDANFDLRPEEAGHPSWGRVFAQAKREAKATRKPDPKKPASASPAASPTASNPGPMKKPADLPKSESKPDSKAPRPDPKGGAAPSAQPGK